MIDSIDDDAYDSEHDDVSKWIQPRAFFRWGVAEIIDRALLRNSFASTVCFQIEQYTLN